MKWKICFISMAVVLLLNCIPAVSLSKTNGIVITLPAALTYHGRDGSKVYIRSRGVSHKSNANAYYRWVQSNVHYSVRMIHHKKKYFIIIGPIRSASEVRKTADVVVHHRVTAKFTAKQAPTIKAKHEKLTHKNRIAFAKTTPEPTKVVQADPVSKAANLDKAPIIEPSKQIARDPQLPPQRNWLASLIPPNGNWLASVGIGEQYPFYKSHMYINNGSGAPPPYNRDLYSTKRINQPTASLAVGYRWVRDARWAPSYSLMMSYQHIFSANLGGTVMQYSTPSMTNYSYDWEVASDVVLALLKLNIIEYKHLSPYVLGGVGGASNLSTNFNEGALPGVTAPRINPDFQSNSSLQWAYRLGLGLDYEFTPQVIFSAEYQYQDIGSIQSDHGTGTWNGQLLRLGPYRSNGVQVGVTYLFDNNLFQ